ncbi:citryl-CoA lyase [Sphingosinicella microcystinivorans]|uniref:citrate synthase (unknown stereospecificity) n=1 Tax=Sphingosinicella microcystinivorans TaxID=335406 RepID=A0AAD1D5U3_SPHMI|nr:citryl-CoA lyase [Sphingosinicella microcystinivorans]RKS91367.1 citrate synthase [Sphingosinicella microcystinivorans]BBE34340.1 citryl-CoA lyase [Sphingosinicella microcystinivorans]
MRIGKQDAAFSAICTSDAERIIVRGRDLCEDIIGKLDFTSYFWLLVTGQTPNEDQLFLTNAVLTAITEHGLVPSVVASRMTYAAAPEAFQGAVAAGLLGCGSVVLGSAETAGNFYAGVLEAINDNPGDSDAVIIDALRGLRAAKQAVPGFGHPQHSGGDPRALKLLALARERGVAGMHAALVDDIRRLLPTVVGRSLPVNVNGAIPAVMLDVGFPLAVLKGIALLARTAGLIGHLQEESQRPIGFILSGRAAEAIAYDGPATC